MIEITYRKQWSDWATFEKYQAPESKIQGVGLSYRGGGDWFAVVTPNDDEPLLGVTLDVPFSSVVEILRDTKIKLLGIVNYHGSNDFQEQLIQIYAYIISQDKHRKRST